MEITFYCLLQLTHSRNRKGNEGEVIGETEELLPDLCTTQKKTNMTHGPYMVAVDPATGQLKSKRTHAEGQR